MNSQRIKINKIIIVLILFQFLWIKSASAQSVNWLAENILELFKNAPWKIGQLHLYRAFYLNNAGYDSDIYYGYMGKTYPDYTLFAGPAFQALVPLQKLIFLDSYQSLQGAFYLKNDKERALNFRSNNQIHFLAKKLYGRTGLSYDNLRDRFSPELTRNVRHEDLSWNGLLMIYLTHTFSTAWQVSASSVNYSHTPIGDTFIDQTLDRYQYYFDFFLFYRPDVKWQYYLNGQVSFYKFKQLESRFKNTRNLAVYLGLEFIPVLSGEKTKFTGNVNIGFKYLQPEDSRFKTAKTIVGNGLMSINLSRLLTWQVYYHRDYDVSLYSGLLYYLQTSFGTGLIFNLTSRLSLNNQVLEGITNYPFSPASGFPAEKLKFYTFSSDLIIRVSRELYFNLMTDLGSRRLYPSGAKFSRQFIGVGLTYGSVPGVKARPDFYWY